MATRKSFDKERWEAMTGMEMSQLLPECENPESAGEVTDHAGNEILPTVIEQSGIQESAEKDGSAPASKCLISGRQRRLSLEEYRSTFILKSIRKTSSGCCTAADRRTAHWRSSSGKPHSKQGLWSGIRRRKQPSYAIS